MNTKFLFHFFNIAWKISIYDMSFVSSVAHCRSLMPSGLKFIVFSDRTHHIYTLLKKRNLLSFRHEWDGREVGKNPEGPVRFGPIQTSPRRNCAKPKIANAKIVVAPNPRLLSAYRHTPRPHCPHGLWFIFNKHINSINKLIVYYKFRVAFFFESAYLWKLEN